MDWNALLNLRISQAFAGVSLWYLLAVILTIIAFLASAYFLAKKSFSNQDRSPDPQDVRFQNVVLIIKVPKENEKEALAAEHMFASLHGILRATPDIQEHLSFEISSDEGGVAFHVAVPRHLQSFVEGQIYAQYPQAEVVDEGDYAEKVTTLENLSVTACQVVLSKQDFFPLKTFREFEVDPLSSITSSISNLRPGEKVWLQLLIRPVPDVWQESGHKYVELVRYGKPVTGRANFFGLFAGLQGLAKEFLEELLNVVAEIPKSFLGGADSAYRSSPPPKSSTLEDRPLKLSTGQEDMLESIEIKLSKMGFESMIRIFVISASSDFANGRLQSLVSSLGQFSGSVINSFVKKPMSDDPQQWLEDYRARLFPSYGGYILNTDELASIFHLPSISVETPAITWSRYRRGEPPLSLPIENCTYIGKTTFRNNLVKFGIRNDNDDRAKHMYLIGKTGTGKSTIFKNMILQDIQNNHGVGVMDPHGELIDQVLDMIPDSRVDDVVLFDPSDFSFPPALNMLELKSPEQKNLMASGLVAAFKARFDYSWGPRLEYLLNNAILTLLEVPGTTLLGITRLLTDMNYQKYILYQVKDQVMREFWDKEFKEMRGNQRLITEAIAPIQNKVGRFLSSSTIRNILGQPHSTIKFDEIMDTGKILLINLPVGKIGDDNASLLGSLIVSRLQFMAMQRINIPEEQRRPFYFYADEFQNFASGTFASILSEARKFKLCLHMTHQYTAQLSEEMVDAVFGNVGTIVSFSLGGPDAKIMASELTPVFDENDLISLEKYNMYVKLMIDGMASLPFSAVSLEPPDKKFYTGNREKVVDASRRKYGSDTAVVEDRISRWTSREFNLGMAVAEAKRRGDYVPPSDDLLDERESEPVPRKWQRPLNNVNKSFTPMRTGYKKF